MPMPATAFVLTIAILAAQQAPPSKFYSEGQEVRVCGDVKTIRTLPPACDTTLRLASTGEEFDVVIPMAVAKELSIRPEILAGTQACFTGRIAAVPGIPRVNVGPGGKVELLSTDVAPGFGADAVIRCGSKVTMPSVIFEKKPEYTRDAMRARVQGLVEVQAVVGLDGTVVDARVVKKLHPDLDEQALVAVRQWRFEPGKKDGKPVPVLVVIELTFRLKDK